MLDCMHYVEMNTFRLLHFFIVVYCLRLLYSLKMNDLNRRLFYIYLKRYPC